MGKYELKYTNTYYLLFIQEKFINIPNGNIQIINIS